MTEHVVLCCVYVLTFFHFIQLARASNSSAIMEDAFHSGSSATGWITAETAPMRSQRTAAVCKIESK